MKWKRRLYWKFILLPYFPSTQKQGLCSVCFASKPRERGLVIDEGSILCSLLYWTLASSMSIHAGRKNNIFEKRSLNLVSLFQCFVSFFSRHFLYEAEQGVTGGLIVAKAKPYCHHGVQPHMNYWYLIFLFLLLLLSIMSFSHCHQLDMNYHFFWSGGRLSWYELLVSLFLFLLLSATGRLARHELLMCVFPKNNKPSLYIIVYTQFLLSPHSLMIMIMNNDNSNNKPPLYTHFFFSFHSLTRMVLFQCWAIFNASKGNIQLLVQIC